MRSLRPWAAFCLIILLFCAIINAMPSAHEDSKSSSLSVRAPGTVEQYSHASGNQNNELAERGMMSGYLLMLLPASMALSTMSIYRGGAANLAFGIGTTCLAIVVNMWWFWWMEGWKEFVWQRKESYYAYKKAELDYYEKEKERDRNNALHRPTLEKATFDAQSARQDLLAKTWKGKFQPKLEVLEPRTKDLPDLNKLWEEASEAVKEATKDELNLDNRESKQKEAEEKFDKYEKALESWERKARDAIDMQELDNFDFQRNFWAQISGEGDEGLSSKKIRRDRIARDGLPNLLQESCASGLCQRVWYSNSMHDNVKRDASPAASDLIHRVYLTPMDYDFRAPANEKRGKVIEDYSTDEVDCEADGEDELDNKPYHTVLELKGTGEVNGTVLDDFATYIKSNQKDALRQIGDSIDKGKKVKADGGKQVTILAHEGWTCIAVGADNKPAAWGLSGVFQDDSKMHENHDDVWQDCKKQLKI